MPERWWDEQVEQIEEQEANYLISQEGMARVEGSIERLVEVGDEARREAERSLEFWRGLRAELRGLSGTTEEREEEQ